MAETWTPYGILLSSFFDGTTGMRIQAAGAVGKDALILGAFLSANEWANMIGLYELSFAKLARKLPILKGPSVLTRAFALLDQERFAHYDRETEFVWVREMARVRLNLINGQVITNQNRLKGAQACYQRSPLNPFLGPFYDRYHVELALKHRREAPSKPLRSPSEAPSKPLRSDSEVSSTDQVPVHQVPVPVLSTQESVQQESARTAVSPQRANGHVPDADPDPENHYAVITALVTKDILPRRLEDHQLVDATIAACRAKHIAFSAEVIRKAIDSALFRYYRSVRLEHGLPADPRGMYRDHQRPH